MRISFNSNPTTTSSQANSQFCGRKTSARRTARQTKQQTGARVIQIKYFRLCGAGALNETAGAVATSTSDCCRLTGNTIAAEKSPAASSTEGIANQGHTRGRYRKTSETCTVFQLIGIGAGFAHCSRRATDRVVSARACAHTHTRVFGESAYIATQQHRLTQLERDTSNEYHSESIASHANANIPALSNSNTHTHTIICARIRALTHNNTSFFCRRSSSSTSRSTGVAHQSFMIIAKRRSLNGGAVVWQKSPTKKYTRTQYRRCRVLAES